MNFSAAKSRRNIRKNYAKHKTMKIHLKYAEIALKVGRMCHLPSMTTATTFEKLPFLFRSQGRYCVLHATRD